jgi:hypothetical protein
MIYDTDYARDNTYSDLWGNTTHNRDNKYSALVNSATIRADRVNIQLYQRANEWDFLTLPFDVKVGDIRAGVDDDPLVIRKYDGEKRAQGLTGETWVNMTADSTLYAGQGYIWQSASSNSSRSYTAFLINAEQTVNKNNIFANNDVELALNYYESEFEHNRSWNLIGNPYPAYYDIRAMRTSSPITIWDTYKRNYQAYSPQDDAYILNPGQAFFVQRPVDEEKITFLKEGRQAGMDVRNIDYGKINRAPQVSERTVFNVILSGNDMSDRTRFVINASAKMDYEAGRDASKFMSEDEQAVQLYTLLSDVRYAINERPIGEGVIELGLQISQNGTYTITLDTQADNEVYLIDRETGEEIRIDGYENYTFSADKGTIEGRFVIRLGDGDVTGIKTIDKSQSTIDNYYNLNGVRVEEPNKGIYIKNGKKVVVK